MPGHWVLAKMGKRVLRPGGIGLTRQLIHNLHIDNGDSVVEFAPGFGLTAQLALQHEPLSYTGVERDEHAAAQMCRLLVRPSWQCKVGDAANTGLADHCANVVYGEAMLSMQNREQKSAIVQEAFRLLQPGGRYGIHELAFVPDDVDDAVKSSLTRSLSDSIRVGARPLTTAEWKALFESTGFIVETVQLVPMHLLEPLRLLRDEGLLRSCRFLWNVCRTPEARKRITRMRSAFRQHRHNLRAILLIAHKPLLKKTPFV